MSSIEALRYKLYLAWEKGASQEILKASQELDVEIVKYMKSSLAAQKLVKQDKHKITAFDQEGNVDMAEMPVDEKLY
ncbi:aspartyl-phosphate phosphatase Spo0E family protein [Desulfosporosinus nitroreducens]|uniref:aspartyl-phosphate phosphatase Spo0E family protein n=1 Tax=Desulfosporosinus nitroreducens TaxID=2018668 RepID=UPI00207C42E0|nr:aspartyl-phosphate phosphatase Spo0E family protein [Desulfosporosinus nitroreducens]MCO1603835.1 aspartyl-phosphate phosphatase Spo0E family protein [Desulfosporosinus nitroreducens]